MENHTSKTGGRPPKKRMEKYHRVVSTKLTELQYYAIRKRAVQAGVPLSNYIRQAVIRGKIVSRMSRQDAEVVRQLAGEANNLNQLARRANAGGFALIVQELLKLKTRIVEIINQLSDDWKNNQGKRVRGCVSYVLEKDQAKLLAYSGVLGESRESIIQSFATQRLMNPNIKKPVGHISLSYSVEDAPKLTDRKMIELTHEYMKAMGIMNTQYIIVRHHDREHPHMHIVFNRIDNNGKTITDKNDHYRNEQVCKRLKQKHDLYFAPGEEKVKQDRLKEPDKTKYEIYTALKSSLKHSKDWQQLQSHLSKDGIEIRFKYKGKTNEVQGISFTKGEYSFKGSEIDRNFSYSKLNAQLNQNSQQQQETLAMKPDNSAPKVTNTGFGIGGSLFGFSNPGNVPDDSEQMRLNELRKKKKKKRRLGL